MKRTAKPVFFIVALLIVALTYTTFFGVYTYYGDRRDTIIRGAKDIRWGIDIRGGIDATFGAVEGVTGVTDDDVNSMREVIAERLVRNNITDHEIYADTANQQVIVRFPWSNDEEDFDVTAAIEELGKTAMLEFHIGSETTPKKDEDGNDVLDENGNKIQVPSGELVLTGDDVESAKVMWVQSKKNSGATEPVVQLTLKDSGREAFSKATEKQKGTGTISIWLDNEMISNPTVDDHITDGIATISGIGDYADALSLSNLINSGALPFAIEVKSSGTVNPTMGEKSLDVMVIAGAIAFVLISVFMVLYYRLPGFVAVISLLGQVAGSVAAVSGYFGFLQSFTLTLPGIAGIILSIGMGVDANIITAERIKEEIQAGKTIDGAIERGSKSSFWAIFDGNVTVIIVSIVLMGVFGPPNSFWGTILKPVLMWFPVSTTGSIYSFGYTLFAGIVFNFLMGVTASRLMLKSITRFKCMRKPWLLGGKRA